MLHKTGPLGPNALSPPLSVSCGKFLGLSFLHAWPLNCQEARGGECPGSSQRVQSLREALLRFDRHLTGLVGVGQGLTRGENKGQIEKGPVRENHPNSDLALLRVGAEAPAGGQPPTLWLTVRSFLF